jgi:hypothetical protein
LGPDLQYVLSLPNVGEERIDDGRKMTDQACEATGVPHLAMAIDAGDGKHQRKTKVAAPSRAHAAGAAQAEAEAEANRARQLAMRKRPSTAPSLRGRLVCAPSWITRSRRGVWVVSVLLTGRKTPQPVGLGRHRPGIPRLEQHLRAAGLCLNL